MIMLSLLWKELRDQDLVGTAAVGVAAAVLLGHFVPLLDNRWDGSTLEKVASATGMPSCVRELRGQQFVLAVLLLDCLRPCWTNLGWALHVWGQPRHMHVLLPGVGRHEAMHFMWVAAALLMAHLVPLLDNIWCALQC